MITAERADDAVTEDILQKVLKRIKATRDGAKGTSLGDGEEDSAITHGFLQWTGPTERKGPGAVELANM